MRSRAIIAIVAAALALGALVAAPGAAMAAAFDPVAARAHATALAALGPRREGTAAERAAADYVAARLAEYGYAVAVTPVALPDGSSSRNVVAVKPGASPRRIVVGAHIDTKAGSPGANDNASGVGVVLELARALRDVPTQPTVVFAFFGAEEMWDTNPDSHHYGSRAYVRALTRAQRRAISGMVSVDMVGYGDSFVVRTMRRHPMTLATRLRARAAATGVRLRYLRDPSRVGWSDHEPFGRVGVPSAWVQWRDDPLYHTPGDTAPHLQDTHLAATGDLLAGYLTSMTARQLRALRR